MCLQVLHFRHDAVYHVKEQCILQYNKGNKFKEDPIETMINIALLKSYQSCNICPQMIFPLEFTWKEYSCSIFIAIKSTEFQITTILYFVCNKYSA